MSYIEKVVYSGSSSTLHKHFLAIKYNITDPDTLGKHIGFGKSKYMQSLTLNIYHIHMTVPVISCKMTGDCTALTDTKMSKKLRVVFN